MFVKAVFPGKYIQGIGAINLLPSMIESIGNKGLILGSQSVIDAIIPKFAPEMIDGSNIIDKFNGESCEEELNRIAAIINKNKIDVIVGMGGGKVIDTAKIAADRANIPVIIVPTIASTDAPTSGCAVTYSQQGVFEKVHYQKMNPFAVIVDLKIIAEAPVRYLVAGMGDALATWFEAMSCQRTKSMNECGGMTTLSGIAISKLCYETLLNYGSKAKIANEMKIVTPELEYIVEANILLSGIGFESSGLASAHAIHNGLTALEETYSYYHGEKVAFGLLSGLHLISASNEDINTVYNFCKEVGLPTTLEEIGLGRADRKRLMLAAEKSCDTGSSIFHEAGEITPEKVLNAMIMADAVGKMS